MQMTHSGGPRTSIPLPPTRAGRLEFGLDDLHDLRSRVAATATAAGLAPARVGDLVAASSELAANSILYGGGRGLATIWGADGAVFVEVADAGTITDPTVGQICPEPAAQNGRGLYIADQLCDQVSIDSTPTGTRIRLRMETGSD
jgi:anti-sigma regulatory factor (Ser/Thr protein kinase)